MKPVYNTILILLIFSIAMGFMESAVVVYLRGLYYPDGFIFPLVPLENRILLTELLREAATLIMLLTIALVAGKNFVQRFAFFLFCFAVWDIFYYVFLWALIGWPSSLLDWDILFLLPVPWIGPVLAPCLLSLTMMFYTATIIYLQEKNYIVTFRSIDWVLMISGSLILIISFTIDYFRIILDQQSDSSVCKMMDNLINFIPVSYNWFVFVSGEALLIMVMALIIKRCHKQENQ